MSQHIFSDRLQKLRRAAQIPLAELAISFSIPVRQVEDWERGASMPAQDLLYRIIGKLNIPYEFLDPAYAERFGHAVETLLAFGSKEGYQLPRIVHLWKVARGYNGAKFRVDCEPDESVWRDIDAQEFDASSTAQLAFKLGPFWCDRCGQTARRTVVKCPKCGASDSFIGQ